jgi:hypothetical protein
MNFFFVRSHIQNKATIRCRFVWWDCRVGNKVDSVGALNKPANALYQAAKLIRCGTVQGGQCFLICYKSSVLHVCAYYRVNVCIFHGDRVEGGVVLVDDGIGTDPPVADGGRAALKIVASCRKASNCVPPMILNGAAGAGCIRACVSSWAAMVSISLDDVRGIVTFAGKNSTVSTILSALVLLIWTL